jgi:hypothetical protein
MIRKVDLERFSLTSSKPFDKVLAAINDEIGIRTWLNSGEQLKRLGVSRKWKAQFKRL